MVEFASGITIALVIWQGAGYAAAGTIYLFIDWTRRFFLPLRDLSAKYSVMQSSMASAERIFELLDTAPAVLDPPEAATPILPAERRGLVEFDRVWFSYRGGEDWVLRDVSFRVEPGQSAAFVGATGAGKTTIIKLLTRLYDVDRGAIRIDGVDLREWPQSELRRRVAMVLQDVFLFSGSIEQNLALGREEIDRERVQRAATAVQADRFIARLPQGYATEVRERGTNLSAGQRQLLSFARALAHGADVLVLDEATSAIDSETEALVQEGIHVLMEGKTALVIAHRLSTIQDADCIHVLHKGQLVESGTHDELMARAGVYERLYRLQYAEQPAPARRRRRAEPASARAHFRLGSSCCSDGAVVNLQHPPCLSKFPDRAFARRRRAASAPARTRRERGEAGEVRCGSSHWNSTVSSRSSTRPWSRSSRASPGSSGPTAAASRTSSTRCAG